MICPAGGDQNQRHQQLLWRFCCPHQVQGLIQFTLAKDGGTKNSEQDWTGLKPNSTGFFSQAGSAGGPLCAKWWFVVHPVAAGTGTF